MARHVHLAIEVTAREGTAVGVPAGAILLRVRGITVLDWRLVGLENTALSLARAAAEDHRAVATELEARRAAWPLFFCAESLMNRCGEIADFSVVHAGSAVTLSEFYRCAVPRDSVFVVPWRAFAGAVLRLGELAVRRGGGVASAPPLDDATLRTRWRVELRARLKPIRARRRALERAASRGAASRGAASR